MLIRNHTCDTFPRPAFCTRSEYDAVAAWVEELASRDRKLPGDMARVNRAAMVEGMAWLRAARAEGINP